jgi:cell division protein FtsX
LYRRDDTAALYGMVRMNIFMTVGVYGAGLALLLALLNVVLIFARAAIDDIRDKSYSNATLSGILFLFALSGFAIVLGLIIYLLGKS